MSDIDLSRLSKLYVNAKNKHKEYIEPVNEDVVNELLKNISNTLESANPRDTFVQVSFAGMGATNAELIRVSNILKEQNIDHSVYSNWMTNSIRIRLN